MNVIYNSDNYYVVEYPGQHGYELVDKHAARGTYFSGDAADKFLESMKNAIAEDASAENVDDPITRTLPACTRSVRAESDSSWSVRESKRCCW